MPELPEVETVVRDLIEHRLPGRMIVKAEVFWPRTVAIPDVPRFLARLKQQRILRITRAGKFIVFHLSGERALLIHLRMTGRLTFHGGDDPRDPHEHVILYLNDGRQLRFRDTRKFGRWYLVRDAEDIVKKLGPGPLDDTFNKELFASLFARKRRLLKPLLLDQTFIAGLGNIYVDEALWAAQLHPEERSERLSDQAIERLRCAIIQVLEEGIRNMGTSIGVSRVNFYSVGGRRGGHQDHLKVFRRTRQPCPRCQTPIQRIIVAQRSTHFCPACQKKSLARRLA